MAVLQHQPQAMELLLIKATNLTLTDLRGRREVHTITEEPQGLVATLGRVTPRTVRLAMAGVIGLGLLLSAESGLVGPLAVSVALALGLHTIGELDPDDTEITHEIDEPGMTAREVERWWVLNDEHERLKSELAEKESKKAERRAKSGGSP